MGKEVEDELTSDSSSSDDDDQDTTNIKDDTKEPGILDSSDDSLTGEMPKGQKRKRSKDRESDEESDGPVDKFRRGEDVPSDYEIASQSDDDDDVRMKNPSRIHPNVQDDHDDLDDQDDDYDDDLDDDNDDVEEDELGAQLEREFLKDCGSSRSSFNND